MRLGQTCLVQMKLFLFQSCACAHYTTLQGTIYTSTLQQLRFYPPACKLRNRPRYKIMHISILLMHHDLQTHDFPSWILLPTSVDFSPKWLLLHVEPLAALLFTQLGYLLSTSVMSTMGYNEVDIGPAGSRAMGAGSRCTRRQNRFSSSSSSSFFRRASSNLAEQCTTPSLCGYFEVS